MEKNARVEKGKTPSIHSGRPSETEKDGEAVCEDEMEKDASLPPSGYKLNDPKIKEIWDAAHNPFAIIDKLNDPVED